MRSPRVIARMVSACLMLAGHSAVVTAAAPGTESAPSQEAAMNTTDIVMEIGDHTVTARLEDSSAARDFLAQLPLTMEFEDYHGIEKISYPPEKLATDDAPAGFDPQKGSFTYFAPWGNLAIFYRDFGYSRSLVNLGMVTSGLEHLSQAGSFTATIRLAK